MSTHFTLENGFSGKGLQSVFLGVPDSKSSLRIGGPCSQSSTPFVNSVWLDILKYPESIVKKVKLT